MKKTTKKVTEILFFGAIWGFLEATVGYTLHLLPVLIAGTIMFPVASFILVRAYMKTQSKSSLIWIGVVAALIKAFDFFLPLPTPLKVIDPMICIVIEALVVYALVPLLDKNKLAATVIVVPAASILWRLTFVTFLVFQDTVFGSVSGQLQSFSAGFTFIVINGLLSGAIAAAVYGLNLLIGEHREWKLPTRPIAAGAFIAIAIAATLIL